MTNINKEILNDETNEIIENLGEKFKKHEEQDLLKFEEDKSIKDYIKEKIKEDEEDLTDLNFVISQNKVIFVDSIKKKEIAEGGKISFGKNYITGQTIKILDKDYGKSAELLRALMENNNKVSLKKILILSILGLVSFIILLIVLNGLFGAEEQNKTSVGITPTLSTQANTQINTNTGQKMDIDMTTSRVSTMNNEDDLTPTSQTGTTLMGSANMQTNQVGGYNQQNGYVYQPQQQPQILPNQCLDSELQLDYKNFELQKSEGIIKDLKETSRECKNELKETNNKLTDLKNTLSKVEEKPKNLTQEAFLLHLGTKIYEQCEKTQIEEEKNKCKDLYFDYVNKK